MTGRDLISDRTGSETSCCSEYDLGLEQCGRGKLEAARRAECAKGPLGGGFVEENLQDYARIDDTYGRNR